MWTPTKLVILAGLGVWRGTHDEDCYDEDQWALEEPQRGIGTVRLIIEQIRFAIELTRSEFGSTGILCFSGGRTRCDCPYSEADSYHALALKMGLLPADQDVLLDRAASTSYENLLFSLACFYANFGRRPEEVVFVGLKHKERRIVHHAKHQQVFDLGIGCRNGCPRFRFEGANDYKGVPLKRMITGEERTLQLFEEDPMALEYPLRDGRERRASMYSVVDYPYRSLVGWPALHGQIAAAYASRGFIA